MQINYAAVLVSAIVSMALGFIWYAPAVFGKQWMRLIGMSEADAEANKKKGMGKTMALGLITSFVTAYILAWFVDIVDAATFVAGAKLGAMIWLGFFATTMLGSVLWEKRPVNLYLINAFYYLVNLIIIGGILAVWV